jgi:hypothetical protein
MNEEAEPLGMPALTDEEMRGMSGENFLRFISR